VVHWERIIHQNVGSSDNEPVGKVIAIPDNEDTIVITSQGSRGEYKLPKSCVQGYNGAEVILTLPASKLEESYKVGRSEEYEAQHGKVLDDEEEKKKNP
jgi:hypothetical protein